MFLEQGLEIQETVQTTLSKAEDLICLSFIQMAFSDSQADVVNECSEVRDWPWSALRETSPGQRHTFTREGRKLVWAIPTTSIQLDSKIRDLY